MIGFHSKMNDIGIDLTMEKVNLTKMEKVDQKMEKVDQPVSGYEGPIYEVTVTTADGKKGRNLCAGQTYKDIHPGREAKAKKLEQRAIAVPGYRIYESGAYSVTGKNGEKAFSLACATGVSAKCVLLGYSPSSPETKDMYNACLHAMRGEFMSGKNTSYTCPDTLVDVYDRDGIQKPESDPGISGQLAFEAAWGKDSILCMSRARYAACDAELKDVPRCPPEIATLDAPWDSKHKQVFNGQEVLIKTRSMTNRTKGGECPSEAMYCL